MSHNFDDSYLANISHEMRSPLNVILGFTRLLSDSSIGETDKKDYVKIIESNSNQLLSIVEEILDLGKINSGNMQLESIPVALRNFFHDYINSMQPFAQVKGIKLDLILDSDISEYVSTDPTRLRQILTNVVGNAIKFTQAGRVEVRVTHRNNQLVMTVTDTGCGIRFENQKAIFAPFTQADSTISRRFGGYGLGLTITKRLCELLNGEFYLNESQPGVGSQFIAKITAKATSSLPIGKIIERDGPAVPGKTELLKGKYILLVEDCLDNQKLISIYLKRHGAMVTTASDGLDGIKKSFECPFDLIIMDVQMPHLNGLDAVEKMRALGNQRPIIALTAHAMRDSREICLRAGYTDFVSKPVRSDDLVQKILQHLPSSN